jgi:hypothetical protein
MNRKGFRNLNVLLAILFTLFVSGCSVFSTSYPADQSAVMASELATKTEWGWRFEPEASAIAQFIFYPGGKVDPQAYALLAKALATKGLQVDLIEFPLDLAVLNANAADELIDNSNLTLLGGHSLGGAMASRYLKKNWRRVDGLVLLASYSLESYQLQDTTLPVVSIYGSNDLVATPEDIFAKKAFLPDDTHYLSIEGGNHAQFAAYGKQKGDGVATISSQDQLDQVVAAIVVFLEGVRESR